jgi:hypothetical protein
MEILNLIVFALLASFPQSICEIFEFVSSSASPVGTYEYIVGLPNHKNRTCNAQ